MTLRAIQQTNSEKWIERLFKILCLVHETLVRFRIIAFNIYSGPPLILQVQFGHANSCANSDAETATAKNKVSSCYFYSLIYPLRAAKWSNSETVFIGFCRRFFLLFWPFCFCRVNLLLILHVKLLISRLYNTRLWQLRHTIVK